MEGLFDGGAEGAREALAARAEALAPRPEWWDALCGDGPVGRVRENAFGRTLPDGGYRCGGGGTLNPKP